MVFRYINTEYLDSISNGDDKLIEELVDMFASQVTEIHREMIALNASGNFRNLGLLAHKAKSSVAIMGMAEMAALLKTFELQAKEGTGQENYSDYIEKFRADSNEAVLELRHLVETRQGNKL